MRSTTIVIVSGLPRSGTSMLMRMLDAGGVPVLTDQARRPDADNPHGYYELERVKSIAEDASWLDEAQGRAVKVVSSLLRYLPASYRYRIIFLRRSVEEVLASQRQMLMRRGEPADRVSDARMAELFGKHLRHVEQWLAEQPNMSVLYLDYDAILAAPENASRALADFLELPLDATRMAAVVDVGLRRQRG
jgi:hypothetical protein